MTTQTLTTKTIAAIGSVAMLAALVAPQFALAAVLNDFTQTELDTNWVADRTYPSGEVTSVSFAGRDLVAAIGIVAEEQSELGSFYYYEGIKKVADFGGMVEVDLYVPSEWEDTSTSPLNVGMWTSDDPLTAYPLIVFRNGVDTNAGFYVYDTVTGDYIESGVLVEYDEWNTLSITLDPANEEVDYAINGEMAGSAYAGSDTIGQVFLNHYNNGELDYMAYWHAGSSDPEAKQECMKGGYEAFGFKNQGQCVQFVETGKDSR